MFKSLLSAVSVSSVVLVMAPARVQATGPAEGPPSHHSFEPMPVEADPMPPTEDWKFCCTCECWASPTEWYCSCTILLVPACQPCPPGSSEVDDPEQCQSGGGGGSGGFEWAGSQVSQGDPYLEGGYVSDGAVILSYEGPGTVSVQSDGLLDVRFSTNVPSHDESGPAPKPDENYVLSIDARGFSVVEAGSEYFLDSNGAALEARGLSTSEVSMIKLDGRRQAEAGGDQPQDVLVITGDVVLELAPELGSGYLEVWEADGSRVLELEFAIGQETQLGDAAPSWWPGVSFCFIRCSLFNSCGIICFPGTCASCTCDDGLANCECVDCDDSGGGFDSGVESGAAASFGAPDSADAEESDFGQDGTDAG